MPAPNGLNFEEIVAKATKQATAKANQMALCGVISGLRLHYKSGELLLLPDYDEVPPDFHATEFVLSMAVPYSQYYRWIEGNSRRLPILA